MYLSKGKVQDHKIFHNFLPQLWYDRIWLVKTKWKMYVKVIVNYSKSIISEFMAKNSYEITHDLITTLFIVLFRKAVVETWVIVQVVLPFFFFFFLKGKCYGIKTKKEDIQRFLHEQARNKKLHHIRLQKRYWCPFQRYWCPDLWAYWASSWATELKLLFKCLKRQVSNESLA